MSLGFENFKNFDFSNVEKYKKIIRMRIDYAKYLQAICYHMRNSFIEDDLYSKVLLLDIDDYVEIEVDDKLKKLGIKRCILFGNNFLNFSVIYSRNIFKKNYLDLFNEMHQYYDTLPNLDYQKARAKARFNVFERVEPSSVKLLSFINYDMYLLLGSQVDLIIDATIPLSSHEMTNIVLGSKEFNYCRLDKNYYSLFLSDTRYNIVCVSSFRLLSSKQKDEGLKNEHICYYLETEEFFELLGIYRNLELWEGEYEVYITIKCVDIEMSLIDKENFEIRGTALVNKGIYVNLLLGDSEKCF